MAGGFSELISLYLRSFILFHFLRKQKQPPQTQLKKQGKKKKEEKKKIWHSQATTLNNPPTPALQIFVSRDLCLEWVWKLNYCDLLITAMCLPILRPPHRKRVGGHQGDVEKNLGVRELISDAWNSVLGSVLGVISGESLLL
jgi:hypothetical protein